VRESAHAMRKCSMNTERAAPSVVSSIPSCTELSENLDESAELLAEQPSDGGAAALRERRGDASRDLVPKSAAAEVAAVD
jgi:hypothetical protein